MGHCGNRTMGPCGNLANECTGYDLPQLPVMPVPGCVPLLRLASARKNACMHTYNTSALRTA